jgi:cell division protein FtsB
MDLGEKGKGDLGKGSPLSLQQENAVLHERIKELEAKNEKLMEQCGIYKKALDESTKYILLAQENLKKWVACLEED